MLLPSGSVIENASLISTAVVSFVVIKTVATTVTEVIVKNLFIVVWVVAEVNISVSDGGPVVVPKIVTVTGALKLVLLPVILTDSLRPSVSFEGWLVVIPVAVKVLTTKVAFEGPIGSKGSNTGIILASSRLTGGGSWVLIMLVVFPQTKCLCLALR